MTPKMTIEDEIRKDLTIRIKELTATIMELKKTRSWASLDRYLGHKCINVLIVRWKESGGIYCDTYSSLNKILSQEFLNYSELARDNLELLREHLSLRAIGELVGIPRADMLYYRLPESTLTLDAYLRIKHHTAKFMESDHAK